MIGSPFWDGGVFGALAAVATWITGFVFFLIWVAVLLLFVRFLLIATRAAKVYLRNNGEHDGLLPRPAPMPAAPAPGRTAPTASAPAAAATKPAPRPRTPKTP